VREPGRAAGDRVRAAELSVDERENQDERRAETPGDECGGASDLRGVERAEEPAGADDRPERGKQEADEPDVPRR
jgi:hypothetical protein